jgi:hypothetical protein
MDQITIASCLNAALDFFSSNPGITAFFLAVVIVSIVVSIIEIVMGKASR